jgi:hypothetical protein
VPNSVWLELANCILRDGFSSVLSQRKPQLGSNVLPHLHSPLSRVLFTEFVKLCEVHPLFLISFVVYGSEKCSVWQCVSVERQVKT